MSLSRILNDDPPLRSPQASFIPHSRPSLTEPVLVNVSPPSHSRAHSSHPPRSDHSADFHSPYKLSSTSYHPPAAQSYVTDTDNPMSTASTEPREHRDAEEQSGPKRRRKVHNDDFDYKPPGQRRAAQKSSQRSKQVRAQSPNGNTDKTHIQPKTEDEQPFVSSDLDDCEEVWIAELGEYILETQKRQNQVERWFEASLLELNSITARQLHHMYDTRIARIPPPPPSPLPMSLSAPDLLESGPLSYRENGHTRHRGHRHKDSSRRHGTSAEDSSMDPEKQILNESSNTDQILRSKGKGKDGKRPQASGAASDVSSDFDVPFRGDRSGQAYKRRKIDRTAACIADDFEKSFNEPVSLSAVLKSSASKHRGKGKQIQREDSLDSLSATPKANRKKPGPKRKPDLAPDDLESASHPPSVAGDVTPAISRPASPAPTISSIVFDFDEIIPPLKKAKRLDDASMLKRVKTLEENQRKVWTNIAKRDVTKVYRLRFLGYQSKEQQLERIAKSASSHARRPFTKTARANKDIQAKAKRLMREMQVFWKKNEKEERDVRKREQKEAMDRLKIEEERREAARQARKLEFLISQTELYSHFVGSKLKTQEIEGDGEQAPIPAGADMEDVDPSSLHDINFDDEDSTNLHRHARHNAQEAIALAKQRAQQFDTRAALERKTHEALKLAKAQALIRDGKEGNVDPSTYSASQAPLVDLDSDELNFQNPTSLSGPLTIGQPQMLMAQLKEYQLKGLNWLATLYEQGINGILADEMGLGKTVQSISLLAYLAETHDIWGPFLVVAPASTLHNWQQEITRFVPRLKALPYWGNVKERATLRKFWSKKDISYNQDAPFHVLITSYQLVSVDQQYLQRVKWQYMILDEAQNIKNSSSVRWKTLLGFHCRNRLLLTGTPIQNSMQELWALLHFIMPSLFDSHDEFNEWFSKDIENAAENKGSKLNEHQLRRLHMILKPFMLRRVKRHVQNELSEKIEKDIYIDLSARQRALYKALLANVSVADLLEKAANIGDADSARSLMNLVMQFRKVCNHPELFERADVVAPFSFSHFGRPGPLAREGDFVLLPYSTRNPIEYTIPGLFYTDGGLIHFPGEQVVGASRTSSLQKLFNIWSTDWIHKSVEDNAPSSFSFLRLLDMSPGEVHSLHVVPLMRQRLYAVEKERKWIEEVPYMSDPYFAMQQVHSGMWSGIQTSMACLHIADNLPHLCAISRSAWSESCLSRPELKWFIPPVVAPPISIYCTDRSFLETQTRLLEAPLESLALYGLPHHLRDSMEAWNLYQMLVPGLYPDGLIGQSPATQLPLSPMQVPEAKRLIYDSAKLARLDSLLQELKAGDHRVLVYFQMTRMMDLMEEYLIFRQYKYLRLDGSSKLEDRRDMVLDWQTRSDIFIFLLSTRAGGLGINLTAADTVIFYDHDWNPSNDAQAMDRAHRLGQTRQVTVYRLITKGTIDERIVQLARVKKDVQDIVVGNKNFTDVTKPSEIVQLLLNDEQLANLDPATATQGLSDQKHSKSIAKSSNDESGTVRDLWNEEGDDFFGHSTNASGITGSGTPHDDDNGTPVPSNHRGGKRRTGAPGATRPRKTGGKRRSGMSTEVPTPASVDNV
ncbi:hypothetical protein AMATHDRAFT_52228 [Amanita thiersii Skay4041]|uniref:Chromatin-remodeling ATPase INO80 n=1 Tax=Amanita thiersii Skay4041 TaxID=703135 RepID=A0A2A9P1G5_9AGAR|nr:hypothetical protein AMATHDRAFT_52228 [Amanita thiersii Skay4041]